LKKIPVRARLRRIPRISRLDETLAARKPVAAVEAGECGLNGVESFFDAPLGLKCFHFTHKPHTQIPRNNSTDSTGEHFDFAPTPT